ncbi:type IV pilin protein [Desulforhopalus sp. IMCC35007]|uniref:type IV pilin protein n=1 Tax=Desulforhopalus sp. IMCC35007 TaxID=2569543 RepID=UPI0010AED1A4|nr:prepilin-type N-terminal cleavage/methylation domain-containing protein [Desulforhopalus sp. IMCC35007]TKB09452.1 prepilin-type N-terminal cleavage/methylation domain-containing protein [Desulforhopalus sp. IMCC35007]
MNLAKKVENKEGFTLIELMIVVAIIGILAAIAVPNFLTYQLKSKTAEAKTNLGAIQKSQLSYRAENEFYADCVVNPNAGVNGQGTKQAWDVPPVAGAGWGEIGYAPAGNVFYVYEVLTAQDNAAAIGNMVANTTGTDYAASAVADLDRNLTNGEFGFATDDTATGAPIVAATSLMAGAITLVTTVEDAAPGEF